MCGFVGFCGAAAGNAERDREIIEKMSSLIVHRGPDSDGVHTGDGIALGFRRLSIIDLAEGSQPMYNESGDVVIVFNGEIYNFEELRTALTSRGHAFSTKCDTEVLVHGYEEWGVELLSRLRGMFAFAIWDAKKRELFCARDVFGIKPFYYATMPDGNLAFCSEIKSLLVYPDFVRKVNPRALRAYLTLQYSAGEETFFDGVRKLPPAHYFVWHPGDGSVSPIRYHDFDFTGEEGDLERAAEEIDRAVNESVEAHRRSDVPLGAFLSGGIDSSYIVSSLMPDEIFTVGFANKNFSECEEAERLCEILGRRITSKTLTPEECFEAFPEIQYHMDEPQANPSSVPLWFLAKLASERVTVVLSGEGADELFGGYELYGDDGKMASYRRLPRPIRSLAARVTSHLPYFPGHDMIMKCSGSPADFFVGQARVFSELEARSILRPDYRVGPAPLELAAPIYARSESKDELSRKQYLDLAMWLPGDILLKADKMSMAHSLELRVPYLDKFVAATATRLAPELRVKGRSFKRALREASRKTLPAEWADRPKKGFPVPIRHWLREEKFASIVRERFDSPAAAEFFDTKKLAQMLDEHTTGKKNNGRKIWTVYTFLVWHKVFFEDFDTERI